MAATHLAIRLFHSFNASRSGRTRAIIAGTSGGLGEPNPPSDPLTEGLLECCNRDVRPTERRLPRQWRISFRERRRRKLGRREVQHHHLGILKLPERLLVQLVSRVLLRHL